MMATLTQEQLQRLARLGAMARLEQIRQEEADIRAAFPELFGRRGRAGAQSSDVTPTRRARKRPKMSAEARKAVSERMRKYWAERRKGK
jgi:hypothetical protein